MNPVQVQARFYGLSYAEINAVVSKLNPIVERLGSNSEDGETLIEAQGILSDLAKYAETMRPHETAIEAAIKREQERRNNRQKPRRPKQR